MTFVDISPRYRRDFALVWQPRVYCVRMASLVHVAVERKQLEAIVKCPLSILDILTPLLEQLGPLVKHPGLMRPHSIDSVGKYINEARFEEVRAQLVSGNGVDVAYKVRKFDVLSCEAADKLPSAQRRQCVAVRGANEVARRLEPNERGGAEVVVKFSCGGTLAVRRNSNPQRLVVVCTDAKNGKKVLDALLDSSGTACLIRLFEEAVKGQRQAAVPPSATSRFVKLDNGAFWELPAWYAEAVALLAQEVFRLHVFVSAISAQVSRSLFVDRVTLHRLTKGPITDHRTLIKAALHRASGGCACHLHRDTAPVERFRRLEFRMEFCGCALVNGRCPTHSCAEHTAESGRFPGTCMLGLKMELHCAHEASKTGARGGVRFPLDVRDERMDLGFAREFMVAVASCGARLARPHPALAELEQDTQAAIANLNDLRLQHAHMGDQIMQRDVMAVYLLRNGSAVTKGGKFVGRVRADCHAILKTHKHLFRVKG